MEDETRRDGSGQGEQEGGKTDRPRKRGSRRQVTGTTEGQIGEAERTDRKMREIGWHWEAEQDRCETGSGVAI